MDERQTDARRLLCTYIRENDYELLEAYAKMLRLSVSDVVEQILADKIDEVSSDLMGKFVSRDYQNRPTDGNLE